MYILWVQYTIITIHSRRMTNVCPRVVKMITRSNAYCEWDHSDPDFTSVKCEEDASKISMPGNGVGDVDRGMNESSESSEVGFVQILTEPSWLPVASMKEPSVSLHATQVRLPPYAWVWIWCSNTPDSWSQMCMFPASDSISIQFTISYDSKTFFKAQNQLIPFSRKITGAGKVPWWFRQIGVSIE